MTCHISSGRRLHTGGVLAGAQQSEEKSLTRQNPDFSEDDPVSPDSSMCTGAMARNKIAGDTVERCVMRLRVYVCMFGYLLWKAGYPSDLCLKYFIKVLKCESVVSLF